MSATVTTELLSIRIVSLTLRAFHGHFPHADAVLRYKFIFGVSNRRKDMDLHFSFVSPK